MLTPTLYKLDSTGKIRTFQVEVDGDKYRMITGVLNGKQVCSKWTVCTPKNVGKINELSAVEQAKAEAAARVSAKLTQDYFESIDDCQETQTMYFHPMLAELPEKLPNLPEFPWILDPKLDGMRLVTSATTYHSRRGKPVPTAQLIAKELEPFFLDHPDIVLDGEIYTHDLCDDFNQIMSIARKTKPTEEDLDIADKVLQYHVYDMFDLRHPDMTALERKKTLDTILPISPRIHRVPWQIVNSYDEMKLLNQTHIADGYEGSICRPPDSLYQNKRSKNLIKIKLFITEEFPIVEIKEGTGNRSGIAGTVCVLYKNGVVGCGIKGSWVYAKDLLDKADTLIGKPATVRHFGETPDGSLRFPICVDINRND